MPRTPPRRLTVDRKQPFSRLTALVGTRPDSVCLALETLAGRQWPVVGYARGRDKRMAEPHPGDVTLGTLHEDLTAGFAEMRSGFADLKVTLVTGFRSLPSRESADEMIRLLREGNRLHEERLTQLDLRIREQHLEIQQTLHAVVEGQRSLIEGQRSLSADIKALIARLDALIRGRGDGEPTR